MRRDAPGQGLVGALGVVDEVEVVDLALELFDGGGHRLGVEVAEQGAVEALVLALGGGLVGLARDRRNPQGADVLHQTAGHAAAGGVQCEPVVGEQALGHPTGGDALVEHGDGRLAGLRAGDQGGDR